MDERFISHPGEIRFEPTDSEPTIRLIEDGPEGSKVIDVPYSKLDDMTLVNLAADDEYAREEIHRRNQAP